MYGWLIGGLTALDLGIKQVIEDQEDETFPRDLPCAKGWIRLYKNHNSGFPFGVLKQKPELVKGIPRLKSGTIPAYIAALLAASGAATPFRRPVPNFSGSLLRDRSIP